MPLSLLRLSLASEERADHARKAALALDDGRGARRVGLPLLRVGYDYAREGYGKARDVIAERAAHFKGQPETLSE